jgi:acid phosphatase family membrane protein YuiD
VESGVSASVIAFPVSDWERDKPDFFQDRLKELLGHTPVQVIAGSVLNVAISWLAR